MRSLAPSVLPGHGGRPTMPTTFAKGAPAMWCGCSYGYGYDDTDFVVALLRGIDAVVRPPNPADLPMPSMEFRALSRRHRDLDADFNAMIRGIPSLRVPVAGQQASISMGAGDAATPTTPFAVLHGPLIYKGDATQGHAVTITPPSKKQCGAEYDADIDSTFRAMETDPAERPYPDYLSDTQAGAMMMSDRAEIIKKMHHLCRYGNLAPGALHRAVSYVDRFLSAKKIHGGDPQLHLLGAVAVFMAAKYEDRTTLRRINADAVAVAVYAGSTRREVLDVERELVAALGYRLSGPTAYTFVDHFMRHSGQENEEEEVIRGLAHHLADMALLDYRCVAFLPSAVAASAIVLARLVVMGYATPLCLVAGYAIEDLRECVEAIYDMHENLLAWPGCQEMMEEDWELTTQLRYSLPPLSMLLGMH